MAQRIPLHRPHNTPAAGMRCNGARREQNRVYGRRWRERLRPMALARAGAFCPKCGKLMTGKVDVHHKKARSRGGADALENLEVMHHECHSRETRRECR
jgi:5-methylcytosine-specific restriction endonuclease McrA